MNKETRQCQNCKHEFTIELEDFLFYEKMKVPAPTFCPECRFQRRLMFRNERALYKRKCDLCGKDMITVYSPDKSYKVYCNPCWWSDKWDGLEYGQDYDSSRNFFEQFRELQLKVPYMALVVDYPVLINSEYVNHAGQLKNCYWVFNCAMCENTHYSKMVVGDKDSMDAAMLYGSELCYEDINCYKCSGVFFSEDISDSYDIYFSKNLRGCSNCFGCINLNNKSYHIFNEQHSKESYEKKLEKFQLDSFSSLAKVKEVVHKFWLGHANKFMHERHNTNVSGDYVYMSKNAHYMYQASFVEDGKWGQFINTGSVKDVYDYTEWGEAAQRIYDCITVGEQADNIKFSFACWKSVLNIEYSMYVLSSSNILGCVGLRNKQYCILNKQYTKEEYEKLRENIIRNMESNPYTDNNGRTWKYGEFLPYNLSLYDYNETDAMDYFPLTKEDALSKGFRWHDKLPNQYKVTLRSENIPDSIKDIGDDILNQVLECTSCKGVYRIIKPELELLRRFGFPIPRKCYECRYADRRNRINPPKLWHRQCAKCGKDIKTSYSPERPEIVYCEACYQNEVI